MATAARWRAPLAAVMTAMLVVGGGLPASAEAPDTEADEVEAAELEPFEVDLALVVDGETDPDAAVAVAPGAVVDVSVVVDGVGEDVARVGGSLSIADGGESSELRDADDPEAVCVDVVLTLEELEDADNVLLACELVVDDDAGEGNITLELAYEVYDTEDGDAVEEAGGVLTRVVAVEVDEEEDEDDEEDDPLPTEVTEDDLTITPVVPGIRDAAVGEVIPGTVEVTNESDVTLAEVRLLAFGDCPASTLSETDVEPGETVTLGCSGLRPIDSIVGTRVLEVTPTDDDDRFEVSFAVPAPVVFDAVLGESAPVFDRLIPGLEAGVVVVVANTGEVEHTGVEAAIGDDTASDCEVVDGETGPEDVYILECIWEAATADLVEQETVTLVFSVEGFTDRFVRTFPNPLQELEVVDEQGLLTCPAQVAVGARATCALTGLFPQDTVRPFVNLGDDVLLDVAVTVDEDGDGAFSFDVPTTVTPGDTVTVRVFDESGEVELVRLDLEVVAAVAPVVPPTAAPVTPTATPAAAQPLPRTGVDLWLLTLLGSAALLAGATMMRTTRPSSVTNPSVWTAAGLSPNGAAGARRRRRPTRAD